MLHTVPKQKVQPNFLSGDVAIPFDYPHIVVVVCLPSDTTSPASSRLFLILSQLPQVQRVNDKTAVLILALRQSCYRRYRKMLLKPLHLRFVLYL